MLKYSLISDFFDVMELCAKEFRYLARLFVVLIQALIEFEPNHNLEDPILINSVIESASIFESREIELIVSTVALYDFHLMSGLFCFDDELRFWVKPQSSVWFSDFLTSMYDDSCWIEFFRMGKASVAKICYRLRNSIEKMNTNYHLAVPVEVHICTCLYKLAHGCNLLTCSKNFAIGRSTVGLVLREVVKAINVVYKAIIQWREGDGMRQVMLDFKFWCGLPSVHGAIDCTQIRISKPKEYLENYYYYKIGRYSVVAQAVMESISNSCSYMWSYQDRSMTKGCFNDHLFGKKVVHNQLMSIEKGSLEGFPPYLFGDKEYPFLSWIMTPFKDDGQSRSLAEILYNNKHRRGRSVVENAFGILKENW